MHPSTIEVLGMIVTGGAIYAAVLLLLHDQFMEINFNTVYQQA